MNFHQSLTQNSCASFLDKYLVNVLSVTVSVV